MGAAPFAAALRLVPSRDAPAPASFRQRRAASYRCAVSDNRRGGNGRLYDWKWSQCGLMHERGCIVTVAFSPQCDVVFLSADFMGVDRLAPLRFWKYGAERLVFPIACEAPYDRLNVQLRPLRGAGEIVVTLRVFSQSGDVPGPNCVEVK